MSVTVSGAVITPKAASVIWELQNHDNDFIVYHNESLDEIIDFLFDYSENFASDKCKNKIFELLNRIHLLRKDINALKAPFIKQ